MAYVAASIPRYAARAMSIVQPGSAFATYMILALLVGCGSSAPAVKQTVVPQPKVEPAPPPPAKPSAFEQRWSSACNEHGAVGECPAPFDRPAVFVDVDDGEHAAPPFCGALESPEGAAARDALRCQAQSAQGVLPRRRAGELRRARARRRGGRRSGARERGAHRSVRCEESPSVRSRV